MKRITALVLSILLVLGLFAACAGQPEVSGTSEASQAQESVNASAEGSATETSGELKPFKLGWVGAGSPELMVDFTRPAKWACDAAGGEMVIDCSATDAVSQLSAVENLISGGCNLISITNYFGDAPMPKISNICNENKVYWVLWGVTVTDPTILETLKNDPYFVGFTQSNQTKIATEGANALIAAGCKNIIAYKYAVGVYTADQRVETLQKICDENGVNIVEILEAPQDPKKAMADALIAHPEADGLYAAGGFVIPMISAIEESNRDLKVVCCDFFDGVDQYFDNGKILSITGGNLASNYIAVMMLLNAYYGIPLTTGADTVDIPVITFTSSEQHQNFEKYCQSDSSAVYGKDDLKMFLKVLNPSLTLESFQQNLNDTWNMDYIVKKFS